MLPFTSIDFFVIIALLIALLSICKLFCSKRLSFQTVLTILSLIYLTGYYPKPWHVLLTVVYSYFITRWFQKRSGKKGYAGILLLLLPLILVKLNIKAHYYPFEFNNWISFAGLSYISFRILSVYLDFTKTSEKLRFWNYLGYLIFTPTLLIGPIDRYNRFRDDTNRGWDGINSKNFIEGWESLLIGLLYKFVFAEAISRYVLNPTHPDSFAVMDMAINMYGYYFYLFFDFAGYSAMAIGVGRMMGIDVPMNFNSPFLARNPQDFWRRFHITLGDFLNAYFFSPIYMFLTKKKILKKFPLLRQNSALLLTFILMGCWNGLTMNFIISGMIFGLYSMVYNTYIYYSRKKQRDIVFGSLPEKYVRILSIFIMFNLAAFSIYIFSGRSPFI